jgi:hypothetical protein
MRNQSKSNEKQEMMVPAFNSSIDVGLAAATVTLDADAASVLVGTAFVVVVAAAVVVATVATTVGATLARS